MKKKDKPTKFNSLLDVVKIFPTEKDCRDWLEKLRWRGQIACHHCGNAGKIYKINDGKLYKCAECRKQFTVRTGTIFEDSAIPLQKWLMAIFLITAHKKGISSHQLARDLEITQKSAWFLNHRIRYALKTKSFNKPLSGIIEVDETYVGGKRSNKHQSKKSKVSFGRGRPLDKAVVLGMVQRGGDLILKQIPNVKGETLQTAIHENVEFNLTVVSDEWAGYDRLKNDYKHFKVDHSHNQYVDGFVHTNTVEGAWSLLKRGIIGIYHHVSPKHLHRYCDEFSYRYNTRKSLDVDRFNSALASLEGRLTYKSLTEK